MGGKPPPPPKLPNINVIGAVTNALGLPPAQNIPTANILPGVLTGNATLLNADVSGDLANPGRIGANIDEIFRPGNKERVKREAEAAAAATAAGAARQAAIDAPAIEAGFVSEADRIKQVSNIINSFGKGITTKRKSPLIFSKVKNKMSGRV